MKALEILVAAGFMIATLSAGLCAQTPPGEELPLGAPTKIEKIIQDFDPAKLKVLPKDITVQQLNATMFGWKAAIGGKCITCHSVSSDPKNLNESGRPQIIPDDDSKATYKVARQMYLMTQEINKDYLAKYAKEILDTDPTPITCGTCHGGHRVPEKFVAVYKP